MEALIMDKDFKSVAVIDDYESFMPLSVQHFSTLPKTGIIFGAPNLSIL